MELRGMSREGLEAYVELAKYYEHRARHPERAAELIGEALTELRRSRGIDLVSLARTGRWRIDFHKRLARLRDKCTAGRDEPLLEANLTESPGIVTESK
jgi:hypothetical protein